MHLLSIRFLLSLTLLAMLSTVQAAVAVADDLPITRLETLVVTGEQPGPGLWKVSKDGHVMWVLGSVRPLPKRMQWNSAEVEARVAEAQQVLMPPQVSFDVDIGFFGGLFLLPSAMKARNNPDKERLVDVLPADVYARWQVLKQRYFGRSRSIEKRRPIVAASKLEDKALSRAGLSNEDIAVKVVKRAAKKAKVPVISTGAKLTITDPKALLQEFNETSLADVECFSRSMARFESDLEVMKLRANAWAMGGIDGLRELPVTDSSRECANAVLQSEIAERRGFSDLRAQVDAAWLKHAEETLQTHERSFAILPMGLILDETRYLGQLAARGYRVEAPDASDEQAENTDSPIANPEVAAVEAVMPKESISETTERP